jgi:aspartate/methionine/tyrosine aminotransferase
MRVIIDKTDRLWKIPQPSLGDMKFARKRLATRGVEVIDLDRLAMELVVPEALAPDIRKIKAVSSNESADYLKSRLITDILAKHRSMTGISLDPEKEICITPGNRIAASLLTLGILNPGECAAYPDPGTPYIRTAICLADGVPKKYGLLESNDYILNIAGLKVAHNKRTKILFINYPHDPTGASVDFYFYRELLKSLRFSNMLVAADCAYVHPGNPDSAGPLQVKNAARAVVELHSFATTFGIPNLGFAVGHKEVVAILRWLIRAHGLSPDDRDMKSASVCLDHAEEIFHLRMEAIRRKREILSNDLKKFGWHVRSGRLAPFVWAKPPVRSTSLAFARRLFIKAGIKVTPGSDFGENGEGWVRMALGVDEKTTVEVIERMAQHSRIWQRKYKPE